MFHDIHNFSSLLTFHNLCFISDNVQIYPFFFFKKEQFYLIIIIIRIYFMIKRIYFISTNAFSNINIKNVIYKKKNQLYK